MTIEDLLRKLQDAAWRAFRAEQGIADARRETEWERHLVAELHQACKEAERDRDTWRDLAHEQADVATRYALEAEELKARLRDAHAYIHALSLDRQAA